MLLFTELACKREIEQHCLNAADGCLSCDYLETESADAGRPPGSPMFVEGVIRRIQAAAPLYLKAEGSILPKKIGRKQNKIKLCWNN